MGVKRIKRSRAARGKTVFPGIERHAAHLGVSRVHLWKVLTGRRESLSLMMRYRSLTGHQRAS